MPTRSSSSTVRAQATCLADVLVGGDRLGDLRSDAVHRVEARERVLEDHRDLLAADLAEVIGRRARAALRPLNSTSPEITVRSRLSSPMIARFETLFPEPDSPTTPSVSPRESEKDTSVTAWTTPSGVGKRTVSPRTSSSCVVTHA